MFKGLRVYSDKNEYRKSENTGTDEKTKLRNKKKSLLKTLHDNLNNSVLLKLI